MPEPRKKAAPSKPSTPRPPRVSGRPASDAAVGRQAIVDATIALLKHKTPEELTVLEVAAAAGVTRSLVRYYFGSLHGLIVEITEQLMAELQHRTEVMMLREGTLYDRVRQRLSLRLDFMREHPQFERMALKEIYYADEPAQVDQVAAARESALERITRRGLELSAMLLDKRTARRVDARFVHLTIVSISGFIATGQPLIRHLFGEGPAGARQLDAYIDFVARLLTDHLESAGSPD